MEHPAVKFTDDACYELVAMNRTIGAATSKLGALGDTRDGNRITKPVRGSVPRGCDDASQLIDLRLA